MERFKLNNVGIKFKKKHKTPDEYKVILLNDNYTTMNFVEDILMKIFHKNPQEANRIMLQVHQEGRGIAGIYTSWDIAITKTEQVCIEAEQHGFPLQANVEPA